MFWLYSIICIIIQWVIWFVIDEDPMLNDQHQYRYMTVDDMKSLGDDSLKIDVTRDEKTDQANDPIGKL